MSEHIDASSQEEGAIEATFLSEVARKGWLVDVATDRGLVGVALHILKGHTEDNFSDQMYRHIAAIGRGELDRILAPGDTVDINVANRLASFIKKVIK